MPATVFHIQAPATLGELDDALVDAVEVWRHATRMLQFRDDRLNRAAVEAARGRVDGLFGAPARAHHCAMTGRADLERLLEGACTAFTHCAEHRRQHDTRFWRQRELDALDHLEHVVADLRPQLAAPTDTDTTYPPEVFT